MPAFTTPMDQLAYAARAKQFLAGCRFPATRDDVVARFLRRNTPMELVEDALDLPSNTFASASDVAAAIVAIRQARDAHSWTSRVMSE